MLALLAFFTLVPKQAFEARRRQLGVTHGVLDRFVAEIALNPAGIDAGCKADMLSRGAPLSRSLLGVKGHDVLQRKCLLLTQSRHRHFNRQAQSAVLKLH
jgi:hypothetical protein